MRRRLFFETLPKTRLLVSVCFELFDNTSFTIVSPVTLEPTPIVAISIVRGKYPYIFYNADESSFSSVLPGNDILFCFYPTLKGYRRLYNLKYINRFARPVHSAKRRPGADGETGMTRREI